MMRVFVLIISTMLLNGCASMNSEYDCPVAKGFQCKSLRTVDSIIQPTVSIEKTGSNALSKGESSKYDIYLNMEAITRVQ